MKTRTRLFWLAALALTLAQSSVAMAQRPSETSKATAQEGAQMSAEKKADGGPVFMCSLTALTPDQRKHHRELTEHLQASVREVRELANGYGFRLPDETASITLVAEWITLERLCCPFFAFQLEVGKAGTPLWLRITGAEGVKEFMQSEFGIK